MHLTRGQIFYHTGNNSSIHIPSLQIISLIALFRYAIQTYKTHDFRYPFLLGYDAHKASSTMYSIAISRICSIIQTRSRLLG